MASFFIFLEAHPAKQCRHHAPCPAGWRVAGRGDQRGDFRVSVSVIGTPHHQSRIHPPDAQTDCAGESEAQYRKEEPVLSHLETVSREA